MMAPPLGAPPQGGPPPMGMSPHPPAPPPGAGGPIGAPPPDGGAPPQPPAPPQQTMPVFNAQLFANAVQLLKDEGQRGFRIDVETDSTVAVDEESEQKAAMGMVQAVGGFLQSGMPMMQALPQSIPLFGKMIMFLLRRFPIGTELEGAFEDVIAKLESQDPSALNNAMQQNGPHAGKAQMNQVKQQIAQTQAQTAQAKMQAEIQKAQLEAQSAQQDHAADMQAHQMDMAVERTKAGVDMQRAQIEADALRNEQAADHANHIRAMTEIAARPPVAAPLPPQHLAFMQGATGVSR